MELVDEALDVEACSVPDSILEFGEEGIRRGKPIDCFGYVPSSHALLYSCLASFSPMRFCEWGSGMGIATGIAEMLGYDASGIEESALMVDASRQFLAERRIKAQIHLGSYFELNVEADLYFVYCWPGQMNAVLAHFLSATPDGAKLLIAYGAEEFRLKAKVL